MKNLIIVRHGNYDGALRLSGSGQQQMEELALKLKPYLSGETRVISSTAERAFESAGVLAAAWAIERARGYDVLWSERKHPQNLLAALRLVRSHEDADTVVVVTHLEYAEEFPAYFGKQELSMEFRHGSIEKGEAVVIDCLAKTLTYVR